MTSQANHGKSLESLIIRSNTTYRELGQAVIEKQEVAMGYRSNRKTHKIERAFHKHKSTVDFIGRYGSVPVAFDAKLVSESASKKVERIRWDTVQPHQATFLDDWMTGPNASGATGISFIVASFDLKATFVVAWHFWRHFRELAERKECIASCDEMMLRQAGEPGRGFRSAALVEHNSKVDLDYLAAVKLVYPGAMFDR